MKLITHSYLSVYTTGRDNNFDLIRHIAAAGVLVSHAFPIAMGRGYSDPIVACLGVTLGGLCVAAFFAISGFLVTASWQRFDEKPSGLRGFLIARGLRIFPGLLAAVLFTVLLGSALTTSPIGTYWRGGLEYVLRTTSLVSISQRLPGVFEGNPMDGTINGPLWTLFYEVALYGAVLLAGIVGVIRRKNLIVVLVALLPALYVLTSNVHVSERIHALSLLGIPFGTGVLAWLWKDKLRYSFYWVAVSCLCAFVMLGSAVSAPMLYFATAVTVLYLGHWRGFPVKWPSRWGDLSYGTYIYAFPMQQVAAQFGPPSPLANMVISLPPTLLLAWISWRYVEKPALALKRTRTIEK